MPLTLYERGLPDMTRVAVRYRVAEGVDVAPFRRESAERIFRGDAPSIRIFIPKEKE